MTASSNTEINEFKSLIEKIDKKIDDKVDKLDDKIEDLKIGQATIKKDLTSIKWLFGVFSAILTLLLSVLIMVLFKLVN